MPESEARGERVAESEVFGGRVPESEARRGEGVSESEGLGGRMPESDPCFWRKGTAEKRDLQCSGRVC